jgi:acetyl-CoA carboxylase biotin carboxyl carrier protein
MKMMNEIPATHDGVITKIYPEREQLIEFGQELFEIKIN